MGQAAAHHQALTHLRRLGERTDVTCALNGLGEALVATGQAELARTRHADALTAALETTNRYEQARAHNGIAATHRNTGDLEQARHHWQHALALYTDLGLPDAETVRAHLTALAQVHPDPGPALEDWK